MRTIVQRVASAQVVVDGEVVGAIGRGLLAYVGVEDGDTLADAQTTARKLVELRLFPGRTPMDHDVREVGGGMLLISQFTLLASIRRGRRPSFDAAMAPEPARALYGAVCDAVLAAGVTVATGRFGAHMLVHSVGDGPITIAVNTRAGTLV
jgi:D-tyrosyl-tRNA(Tyr) deacylase